jgi:hypothetical protein
MSQTVLRANFKGIHLSLHYIRLLWFLIKKTTTFFLKRGDKNSKIRCRSKFEIENKSSFFFEKKDAKICF